MDSLSPLRKYIAKDCVQIPLDEKHSMLLTIAAVEVVTNIVRHAEGLTPESQYRVDTLFINDDKSSGIELTISYPGQPYIPNKPEDEIDYSTRPEGGFGNFIIHRSCDYIHFEYKDGHNEVKLAISQAR
jgi:anti-sigma regulatory factor (Ser/Thr protein kinase)